MESRDRQPLFANGVDCAVCGRLVPAERIRILARRDDLAFVELACESCRSDSLGIIVEGESGSETTAPAYGEFLPADDARFRDALPIGLDDVVGVRAFLAGGGDLQALLGRSGPPGPAGRGGRSTEDEGGARA
jgi:hypothetical protein